MRHLIEIGLTVAEWIEDTRGRVAARNERRKLEKKSILTFLSQGAVGGAIGYFLMVICVLNIYPPSWSLAYLVILPILLFLGAVFGVVIAFFVWLASVLLQRRLRFVGRAVIVVSATTLLSVLFSYLLDTGPTEQPSLSWIIGLACVLELPVVLMTGSRIRPCHLLLLGVGPRNARHNFGNWISYPAGFLLRVVSVFGLFETLLMLALWISVPYDGWQEFSAPEYLPATLVALLYFPASVYFSLKTPRKTLLLPTVIFLNVPLAAWLVHLTNVATEASIFLSNLLLALICLWVTYTLGCLIAPAASQPAIKSWRETMAGRILPTNGCQVQR